MTADLSRLTAERDRARSDLELERNRADQAERDSIEHRARADERKTQVTDLAQRLDIATAELVRHLEQPSPPAAPEVVEQLPVTGQLAGWVRRRFTK